MRQKLAAEKGTGCESQTGSLTPKSRQEEGDRHPNGEKTIQKTKKEEIKGDTFQISNLEDIQFLKKTVN